MLWNAIKPLLAPRTAEKIVFLGGDYKEKIRMYFSDENIPSYLGGKDKFGRVAHTIGRECSWSADVTKWIVDHLGPPSGPVWPEKKKGGWLSWLKGGSKEEGEEEEEAGCGARRRWPYP